MPVNCQSNWSVANIALSFPIEPYSLATCYLIFQFIYFSNLCGIYYDLLILIICLLTAYIDYHHWTQPVPFRVSQAMRTGILQTTWTASLREYFYLVLLFVVARTIEPFVLQLLVHKICKNIQDVRTANIALDLLFVAKTAFS